MNQMVVERSKLQVSVTRESQVFCRVVPILVLGDGEVSASHLNAFPVETVAGDDDFPFPEMQR